MEMLVNIQTNQIAHVMARAGKSVALKINDTVEQVSQATIRRWWKPYTPTPTVQPVPATQHNRTELATHLISYLQDGGCTVKETKSYIGLKYGKSTVMEIHTTKKGNTTIVISSKALTRNMVEDIVYNDLGTVVPESYGWKLNLKIKADLLTINQLDQICRLVTLI